MCLWGTERKIPWSYHNHDENRRKYREVGNVAKSKNTYDNKIHAKFEWKACSGRKIPGKFSRPDLAFLPRIEDTHK